MGEFNPFLESYSGYALAQLQEKADSLKAQGQSIINLTVGDPKGALVSQMKTKLVQEIEAMSVSQYPSPIGHIEYRQAVSDWAKKHYQINVSAEDNIISCNGSKEAIFSFPLALNWGQNKRIYIPSLSYPVYASSAGLLNIPIHYLPISEESHFLPDLDQISPKEWDECGLFWLNSPHNPTSAIADSAYVARLLELAEKHRFWVCSDECYNDLYYTKTRPASCLDFPDSDRWVVFRSLSKRSHMTGFRIGALISQNKALIKLLKKMRATMGVGTPTFIQKAAIKAWEDEQHPKAHRDQSQQKRDILKSALNQLGFDIFGANAGFYLWAKHPQCQHGDRICEQLLNIGILATPGAAFGKDGQQYIRMVYCDTLSTISQAAQQLSQLKEIHS